MNGQKFSNKRQRTFKRKAYNSLRHRKNNNDFAYLLPQIIFETDAAGNFIFINRDAYKIFGYCEEDFKKGLNVLQMLAPEEHSRAIINIQRVLQGENLSGLEYMAKKKDCTTFPIAIYPVPIIRENNPAGMRGLIIDISQRKQAEQRLANHREQLEKLVAQRTRELFLTKEQLKPEKELRQQAEEGRRETEQIFRQVMELTPEAICIHSEDKLVFVNRVGAELLGAQGPDALQGLPLFNFVHPDDRDIVAEKQREMQQTGKIVPPFEQKFIRTDGTSIYVEASGVPLIYKGKKSVLIIARDITERKETMEALREAGEKYRLLVKYAPAAIYEIDFLQGKFTSVNDVMCQYTGYTEEELLSMNSMAILSQESQRHFLERLAKMVSGESISGSTEFKIIRKDGGENWALINASYKYRDKIPVGATVVAHNITERKEMEEVIRESEKKFKEHYKYLNTLIQNMNELFLTYDDTASITFVNKKIYEVLGYSPDELIGNKLTNYVAENYRNDVEKRIYSGLWLRKEEAYETCFVHKDGRERILKMNATPIIDNEKVSGGMILAEDITELRQVIQEMVRLDRLNIVGEMAASIGHEIRNPMTSVRGFLQYLMGKKECLNYKDHYKLMIEELDRANDIITQFLSLARNKPVDKKMQNLNGILKAIFPMLQADAFELDKHIELSLSEIPNLLLDEKEIRQLVFNLCRNGLEVMTSGGRLTLSTFFRGAEVILSIQDQGTGIAADLLEKLGTPFLTTKESGTGLGVAVCYRIAESHNAKINVETGGGGTTFEVVFDASGGLK